MIRANERRRSLLDGKAKERDVKEGRGRAECVRDIEMDWSKLWKLCADGCEQRHLKVHGRPRL